MRRRWRTFCCYDKYVLWQPADSIPTENWWEGAWHEVRTGTSGNRFLTAGCEEDELQDEWAYMQSVREKLTELSVETHSLLIGACENAVQNRCAIQRIITDKKQKVKVKGNEQQVACLKECVVKVETELQKTHDDILELRHERAVRPRGG